MRLSASFFRLDPIGMRLNFIEGVLKLKCMEKFESPILRIKKAPDLSGAFVALVAPIVN